MSESSSAPKSPKLTPSLRDQLPRRAAHAMRTPLSLVVSALRELGSGSEEPLIELGHRGARQLMRLADRLSLLGRLERGEDRRHARVDLVAILDQALGDVAHTRQRRRVQTSVSKPERLEAVGSGDLLQAAFAELIDNAVRLARRSVEVELSVDDDRGVLVVRDDGPGPSATAAAQAEPGGLGIGLHLVQVIVAEHDGHCDLRDADDGGGVARLELRRDVT